LVWELFQTKQVMFEGECYSEQLYNLLKQLMAHTACLSSQSKLQLDSFLDPGTTQHMYY
jgi:hypothetical protein